MLKVLNLLYKTPGPLNLYVKASNQLILRNHFTKPKYLMERPKFRENPIVTKLDSPEFHSIFTDELNALSELFSKNNYEIRIAGGAVRDLLMGIKPHDIDFATTATPDQMIEMFTREQVRMINMKGEKHGTITPRINDKENFEVTTLRIDVVTDGRHAEVEFTTDWMLDANRRDLTINSMFLGLDGSVYDYFFGYEDLQQHRVAFVGDSDTRIKEDYLRILRYFRFYGKIAKKADCHDENTLRIISQNISGLEKISGERIWSELKKILGGRFAGELIKTIIHVGSGKYCGLPENSNIEELSRVWEQSKHLNLHPTTLLATLLNNEDDVMQLHARLKFSSYDRDLLLFIVMHRNDKQNCTKPLLSYQKLLIETKFKISDTREWILELLKYQNNPLLMEFRKWNPPKFPLGGHMIREAGVKNGKLIGSVLSELRKYWLEHDFKPSSEELLKLVPDIKSKLEQC